VGAPLIHTKKGRRIRQAGKESATASVDEKVLYNDLFLTTKIKGN